MKNYQLPELDYAYSALEPIITKEMLEIHHDKHHRSYVDNLNKTLSSLGSRDRSLDELVKIRQIEESRLELEALRV